MKDPRILGKLGCFASSLARLSKGIFLVVGLLGFSPVSVCFWWKIFSYPSGVWGSPTAPKSRGWAPQVASSTLSPHLLGVDSWLRGEGSAVEPRCFWRGTVVFKCRWMRLTETPMVKDTLSTLDLNTSGVLWPSSQIKRKPQWTSWSRNPRAAFCRKPRSEVGYQSLWSLACGRSEYLKKETPFETLSMKSSFL